MLKKRVLSLALILALIMSALLPATAVMGAVGDPGMIEAESYSAMLGIQTETCAEGGLNVGYTDVDDWMDYSVNVQAAGTYTFDFRVSSPNSGNQLQLLSGTTVLTTVTIPNTGGWQTWQTATASVSLNAGIQTLRVKAVTNGWNFNWMNITSATPMLQVATPTFTPVAGTYTSAQNVTIACGTAGTTIKYTTDGTTPTATSATYTAAINVAATTTIKAIAIKSGMTDSAVATAAYTISATSVNLALNKLGTASSGTPGAAFDGNTGTRWESNSSDPQWIYVDLGANNTVSSVKLNWETASGKTYKIQVSSDTATWTDVYTQPNGAGGIENLAFTPVTARYVRMYGTVRNTIYGYSLWEFEVYGQTTPPIAKVVTPSITPATGAYTSAQTVTITDGTAGAAIRYTTDGSTPTATTGTVYSAAFTISATATVKAIAYASGMTDSDVETSTITINTVPVNLALNKLGTASSGTPGAAFDGNTGTRWESNSSDPQWIYVDLGANNTVSSVKLNWETASGKTYKIQVSSDTVTWTDVYTQPNGAGGIENLAFTPVTARYVRMYGTVRNTIYGYSLWEFEVYGQTTPPIAKVVTPSITPATGTYTSAQTVTITDGTAGATIRYTTDGSTPTATTGTVYTAAFTVSASATVKAIAYASGMTNSDVATSTITINIAKVVTPSITPATGTYTSAQTVTITDGTAGAAIRYTTDGSTPTATTGTVYSAAFTISATATVKAIAYASGMTNSDVATSTISISTAPINLALNKLGTASSGTPGAAFDGNIGTRWESNSSDPQWIYVDLGANNTVSSVKLNWETASGKTYKIQVSTDTVTWTDVYTQPNGAGGIENLAFTPVTARYVRMYGTVRNTAWGYSLWEFEVYGQTTPQSQVATPTFTPGSGTYTSTQNVTIACATAGATIKYTTDGTTPTAASATYTAAINVVATTTVKVMATKSGMTDSAVTSATYTINVPTQVATPTFTPAAGTYASTQSVTIACATAGATIKYTTDGTTPTAASATYTAAINVAATTTVKVIATKSGMTDSTVATALYTISTSTQVAIPTFTPPAGTYSSAKNVTISCSTAGATIKYTTDGTTPTAASATYTAAINVAATTTIKAYAIKAGMSDSSVAVRTYTIYLSQDNQWNLVWNDEFDGTAVDTTKWRLEDKGDGFGNQEEQYYKPDNAVIENGNLVIKAKKETYGGRNYTSAKLFSKADWKYGKFEAEILLPVGQGFWPAFWMMPANDVYGGWAASGELDIMEARGRLPGSVAGTLHYGASWPSNKYTGSDYFFPQGQSIAQYHTYTAEWEPGEIRWYVDGILYQTQNNWSTKGASGEEKYAFPAPFDQKFYLMLNLAIGGAFDGGLSPADSMFPTEMKVNYVRVYELTGRPYMTPVEAYIEKEPLPTGARQPDATGNLVKDNNYEQGIKNNAEGVDTEFGEVWNFIHNAQFGGAATATVEKIGETNFAKINVTNVGSQPYSVQFEQQTTLGKGRWYKYSFDAKADKNRTLGTKLSGGPTAGWAAYSDAYTEYLTTDLKHFEHEFQMANTSDVLSRIEINCATSTGTLWIGNVRIEEIDKPSMDYSVSKAPLPISENNIYNGAFDKYTIDRMAYWNVTNTGTATATVSVPEATRELTASITNGGTTSDSVTANQKGIQLIATYGYKVTFKARSDAGRNIRVKVASKDGSTSYMAEQQIALTTTMQEYQLLFTMGALADMQAQLIFMMGGNNADVFIDDVSLITTTKDYTGVDLYPVKNGDFALGLTKWEPFTQGGAATYSANTGEAAVSITNLGTESWNVMLNQGGLSFKKGMEYEFSFDARASVARDIEACFENAAYVRNFQTGSIDLTTGTKHFAYTFKMAADDTLALKFILGKTAKAANGIVYIDNVVLQVKDAPVKKSPMLAADTTANKVGQTAEIIFGDDAAWRAAISTIKVNGTALTTGYSMQAGKLTIAAGNFTTDDNYLISIEANGYIVASVEQKMLPNDGNQILNGNMSKANAGWAFWNNAPDWSSYKIENGVAAVKINYHGAKDNEWSVPFSWSTQFAQSGIVLEAGKTYELSFKAWSDVNRPILVELSGYNNGQQISFNITGDQSAVYKKTITVSTNVTMSVTYLLGYIENGTNITPAGEHTVYIDDVAIREAVAGPILTADKVANRVGQNIDITFADNVAWRNAITSVKVDGIALGAGKYSITAGKISINSSVFTTSKMCVILVEATGYGANDVAQNIVASDGNVVKNGGMTSSDIWKFWNNTADWSSYIIQNGVAAVKINYHGATDNEWLVPFSWSTQFSQAGILLEAGKTYELSFKAWSSANRPIQVELNGYNGNEKVNFDITNNQTSVYTKSMTISQDTAFSLIYLLGNVINGSIITPAGEHTVYIDDVVIREV